MLSESEKINCLSTNDHFEQDHFEQCISSTTLKFFNSRSPAYWNDTFKRTGHPNTNTRTSFLKLNQSPGKLIAEKKCFLILHLKFETTYQIIWRKGALIPANTKSKTEWKIRKAISIATSNWLWNTFLTIICYFSIIIITIVIIITIFLTIVIIIATTIIVNITVTISITIIRYSLLLLLLLSEVLNRKGRSIEVSPQGEVL